MTVDLLRIIQNMFMDKYSRKDINGQFASYFNRIIGVSNKENYDDILSTLNKKCYENSNVSLIFDGEIHLNGEIELIEYIYNERTKQDGQVIHCHHESQCQRYFRWNSRAGRLVVSDWLNNAIGKSGKDTA